jgi:predicted nucleotidyltransferase
VTEFPNFSPREKEVLGKAEDILIHELSPARIILFGSRAKGTQTPGSDFDLAVDAPRPERGIELKIREEIETVSGLYKVDVVYLGNIEEAFKNLILKTGKVIYGS